ncbi:HD domain-containing protein [Trinickia mobilis]|uniref:HD domain-containing protein n=1 Tax=Trinickia mobilis TaxID=2816356 RepID=UPI0035ABBBA1
MTTTTANSPQLKIMDLPPAIMALWAKSGDPHGHPLLLYMLDVAAVTESLLGREPRGTLAWAAVNFGIELVHAGRWLGALVGLHDFGKASPGFQVKWP